MKKFIISIILIFWLGLIFSFSNQPSNTSSNTSSRMMDKIVNITENITNNELDDITKNNIYEYGMKPLRKCAHFFLYFILGILLCSLIYQYKLNNIIIVSLLFCLLYACSDEIHQLFITGRSGNIKDVFIDTMGSLLGIVIISKVYKIKLKTINK